MIKALVLLFLLPAGLTLYAQAQSLDPSFGTGGYTLVRVPGSLNTHFQNGALQTDGKIIASGWVEWAVSSQGPIVDFVVARFLETGALDTTFGTGGFTITDFGNSDLAYGGLVIQKDGKIVVGGRSDSAWAFTKYAIARYNPDGSPDASFGNDGKIAGQSSYMGDQINDLVLQDDNKIIAVGHLTGTSQVYTGFVLRFNSDGEPDDSFGSAGRVSTPISGLPVSVIVQPDSKILLTEQVNFTTGIVRYNNDGSLDNSFGNNGVVVVDTPATTGTPWTLALQADNSIVIAGWKDMSESGRDACDIYLARFTPNGSLDPSFGAGGVVTTRFDPGSIFASSIIIQDNGKIMVGGYTQIPSDRSNQPDLLDFALVWYHPDGSLDTSFGQGGKVVTNFNQMVNKPTSSVISKLLHNENRLYAVGFMDIFEHFNDLTDFQSISNGVVASYKLEEGPYVTLSCPGAVAVSTDADKCSAVVNNIDPVLSGGSDIANYVYSGATSGSGTGSVSGTVFNKGITIVTYSLPGDPAKTCSFTLAVNDLQPPRITNLVVIPSALWPPDHRLHTVTVNYDSWDNCAVNTCNVTVTSNKEDSTGAPDWEVINDHQVRLRAESGSEIPRFYYITVTCKDAAGNQSTPSTIIVVVANAASTFASEANTPSDPLKFIGTPNPSASDFKLTVQSINNSEKINIRIFDALGRMMEQKSGISVTQSIRVGSLLEPGVYFAEAVQGNSKAIIKLIKIGE